MKVARTVWRRGKDSEAFKVLPIPIQIIKPFLALGLDEQDITFINYFLDTKENMKRIIEDSEIVFFTGGLPEAAIKNILDKELVSSVSKNKVMIGVSAGALIQLKEFYVSPDEDYPEFMYVQGLGLIQEKFHVEVHYAKSELQVSSIHKVLKEKNMKIYAIKNEGGMILDNGVIKLMGEVDVFISDGVEN